MRRGLRVVLPAIIFSLSAATAFARAPLTIPTQSPQNFQAVQSALQLIPPYLAASQCGGWNMNQSVGGTWGQTNAAGQPNTQGTIAGVTGVPGHTGKWNGNIPSGMGTRQGAFQYPNSAGGFTTACNPDQNSITKFVWQPINVSGDPLAVVPVQHTYTHPYFQDPSCRWRYQKDDGTYADRAPDWPNPLKPLDQGGTAPNYKEMKNPTDTTPHNTGQPGDRQSPQNCENFCEYINSFQYEDCLKVVKNPKTNQADCLQWGRKYLCTDQAVTPNSNPDTLSQLCQIGNPGKDVSNTTVCTGQTCRCEAPVDAKGKPVNGWQMLGCVANPGTGAKAGEESTVFYSYFRMYTATAQRASVQSDVSTDQAILLSPAKSPNIPVACYGFYNEFDPLTHQTQNQDKRCVIDVDVSNMLTTQMGKGSYGQNTPQADVDPEAGDNQRPPSSNVSSDGPLWFTGLGWGFSLLNEKAFQGDGYNEDLTNVFGDTSALDKAKMTASWPVANTAAQAGNASSQGDTTPRRALSDTVRSFDDTGSGRIIATWWQKQQTAVSTLLHPVVVRLILPAGYSFGVDPTDPIFAQSSSASSSNTDPRDVRMEQQIGATDDLLGEALASIQNSLLLHLEQQPVPVMAPFGSPTEFRAKAQAWCSWYIAQEPNAPGSYANCDNTPDNPLIGQYIDQLNSYADDIEKVRLLRTELANYAGKLLALQQQLTKPISDWVEKNLTAYRTFLQQQKQLTDGVTDDWSKAEQAMNYFDNQTNMPWCMNQRFETPIFSLLDPWLPSRGLQKGAGLISPDGLPDLSDVNPPSDIIIDFSHLKYLTGSLVLPVLKPVQVALAIDAPTDADSIANFKKTLPVFPSMDSVMQAMSGALKKLPKVQTGSSFTPLKLPPIDNGKVASVHTTIRNIVTVILGKQAADALFNGGVASSAPMIPGAQNSSASPGMNDIYDAFWKSIGPLTPGPNTTPYNPSKQCGSETIQNKKEHLQCCGFNGDDCQQVEMDLIERFQRIASRKLVFLPEDYTSTGSNRLTPDTCLPQDQACLILHGELAGSGYEVEIKPPAKGMPDLVTGAAASVRAATLPVPDGGVSVSSFPTYITGTSDVLPIQNVPQPIDLTPPSSSSASANSPLGLIAPPKQP